MTELLNLIKLFYVNQVSERTLLCYTVPVANLMAFAADKRIYNIQSLPEDQYRVKNEEIEP